MPSFLAWVVVGLVAFLSWRIVRAKTKPRDSKPDRPAVIEQGRRQAHAAPLAAVPPDATPEGPSRTLPFEMTASDWQYSEQTGSLAQEDALTRATATDLYASGPTKVLRGVQLHLRFRDTGGKITEREVESIYYQHDPVSESGALWAYCRLRQKVRPFRFSGVDLAIDLTTGQIIPKIGAFLDAAYSGTPQGQLDRFVGAHGDAVQALLCVCKADGYLRANERTLILEYAHSKGLQDPALVDLLSRQLSDWSCGKVQFWAAVKAHAAQGATTTELQALLDLMRQLVLLDKKAHPDELALLKYAAKTWKLPAINL